MVAAGIANCSDGSASREQLGKTLFQNLAAGNQHLHARTDFLRVRNPLPVVSREGFVVSPRAILLPGNLPVVITRSHNVDGGPVGIRFDCRVNEFLPVTIESNVLLVGVPENALFVMLVKKTSLFKSKM